MTKHYKVIAVGSDAEAFAMKGSIPMSVVGKLKGTKQEPHPVPDLGDGFSVQVDNVLAEFNVPAVFTPEPGESYQQFLYAAQRFGRNVSAIRTVLAKHFIQHDASLFFGAALRYPTSQLKSEQARTFGCDPDFCVWTRTENVIDRDTLPPDLRTAGGHIHVSLQINGKTADEEDISFRENFVKALDLFLGVPLARGRIGRHATYPHKDQELERRKMYGRAGAFRLTKYPKGGSGIEYRTLSSDWVDTNPMWVFAAVHRACAELNRGLTFSAPLGQVIQKAINNGDTTAINYLNQKFQLRCDEYIPHHIPLFPSVAALYPESKA